MLSAVEVFDITYERSPMQCIISDEDFLVFCGSSKHKYVHNRESPQRKLHLMSIRKH
jgi:hypothetical protein